MKENINIRKKKENKYFRKWKIMFKISNLHFKKDVGILQQEGEIGSYNKGTIHKQVKFLAIWLTIQNMWEKIRDMKFHSRRSNVWSVRVPEKRNGGSWGEQIMKQIMREHFPELSSYYSIGSAIFCVWDLTSGFLPPRKKKAISVLCLTSTHSSVQQTELIFCQPSIILGVVLFATM